MRYGLRLAHEQPFRELQFKRIIDIDDRTRHHHGGAVFVQDRRAFQKRIASQRITKSVPMVEGGNFLTPCKAGTILDQKSDPPLRPHCQCLVWRVMGGRRADRHRGAMSARKQFFHCGRQIHGLPQGAGRLEQQ